MNAGDDFCLVICDNTHLWPKGKPPYPALEAALLGAGAVFDAAVRRSLAGDSAALKAWDQRGPGRPPKIEAA